MDKYPPMARGEIGAELLLAGSNAFRHLAEELSVAHRHWEAVGADEGVLEWSAGLAAMAGWWSGRLKAEADLVADINSSAALRPSSRRCHRPMPPQP
jgi:hypothetical protein